MLPNNSIGINIRVGFGGHSHFGIFFLEYFSCAKTQSLVLINVWQLRNANLDSDHPLARLRHDKFRRNLITIDFSGRDS